MLVAVGIDEQADDHTVRIDATRSAVVVSRPGRIEAGEYTMAQHVGMPCVVAWIDGLPNDRPGAVWS